MADNSMVLVVDDDSTFLEMLEDLLTETGYRVVTAGNAGAAFDALLGQPIDVVLTDLNLGDSTGFEILEGVSRVATRPATILMTALVTSETETRAHALGVCKTLQKPFRNEELLRAIEAASAHQASRSSPPA